MASRSRTTMPTCTEPPLSHSSLAIRPPVLRTNLVGGFPCGAGRRRVGRSGARIPSMPPDVIDVLSEYHAEMTRLLDQLDEARRPEDLQRLFVEIAGRMAAHESAE